MHEEKKSNDGAELVFICMDIGALMDLCLLFLMSQWLIRAPQ